MSGTRAASLWRDRGPAQSVFRRPDDALKVQWRPKTGSEHKAHHKTAGARAGQVFREAILGRLDHAPSRDQAATVSALPPPLPAQPLATTTPRAPFRPRRRSDRGRLSIRYASCLSLRMALLRARCPRDQRQPRGQRHSAIRSSLRLTPIAMNERSRAQTCQRRRLPIASRAPQLALTVHLVVCLDILLKRYDASKMSAKVRARVPRPERRRAR